MNLAVDNARCCGCTACMSVCPPNAIHMQADAEGFLYPVVDENRCVHCGLCEKACFFNDDLRKEAYAAQTENITERMNSQSGGMFFSLAKYFINIGGVVYGCCLDEDLRVVHKRAETLEECKQFRGSKYVQSNMGKVYSLVMKDLNIGRKVLFSGTPCQCEGLLHALGGKGRNNLVVTDVICYGVPSPKIWHDYIKYLEHKYQNRGGSIAKFLFRDKQYGWHSHVASILFENKKISNTAWADLFGNASMLRPSCSQCRFSNLRRNSDITLGDCWGIEKIMPELDDNTGISLVVGHTENGIRILHDIFDSFPIKTKKIFIGDYLQPRLRVPTFVDSAIRKQFWKDYANNGIQGVIDIYTSPGWKNKIRRAIRKARILLRI